MMKREEQILQAAEKLFYERNFDGVGVDAIGKEAGVTGSAIYRHFESKDEILSALFNQATDALLLKTGEPKDDPREELAHLIRAHVGFAVSHHRLAAIWAREQRALSPTYQRGFQRRQHHYIERWITCLDACFPGHSRDELVSAVRGVHALLMSDATRPPGGKRAPNLQTLLTNLALASLTALEPPSVPTAAISSTAAIGQ